MKGRIFRIGVSKPIREIAKDIVFRVVENKAAGLPPRQGVGEILDDGIIFSGIIGSYLEQVDAAVFDALAGVMAELVVLAREQANKEADR